MSAGAAFAAWRFRTLTPSGTLAAWTVGVLVLHGTGWQGGAVLALLRFEQPGFPSATAGGATRSRSQWRRRDLWQVYANGGAAALVAGVGLMDSALGIWLVTATLAAAAADTWATSLGTRSRVLPRLPWSGYRVPAGTSGGMTLMGTAGGAAGALIVAGAGAIALDLPILLPIGTLIGFFGMVADSTLGALLRGAFTVRLATWPANGGPPMWRRDHREGGMAW